MKWRKITDTKLVDFYGAAPAGSLLYDKRVSYTYTNRRVLYCNLPRMIGDLNILAAHLLRFPGLSGNNTWGDRGSAAVGFSSSANLFYEVYADALDLPSITTSNNPDGTGAYSYNAFVTTNLGSTTTEYAYVSLDALSLPSDQARSMRLYLVVGGSDGEFQLNAPGGIELSDAAIAYNY